jgi:FkbM family methyltransferase
MLRRSALLRTYCRLDLPGSRRLLWRALSSNGWSGRETVPLEPHGFEMDLDLSQVHDRWSYLAGRYYEDLTQRLLLDLLRAGESFIDVGANIGHLTLTAAHRVGPTGHVTSFEPNPQVFERLSANIERNALGGIVNVHNLALGETEGVLRLTVPVEGTGGATLGRLGSEYSGGVANQHNVLVATGDAICHDIKGPVVIKVDVEGFEAFAIAGLASTIQRTCPALIVEAWPEHLLNAGSSIEALLALAADMGYRVYAVHDQPAGRGRRGPRPILRPILSPEQGLTDDVVWLHPDGVHTSRVAHMLEP